MFARLQHAYDYILTCTCLYLHLFRKVLSFGLQALNGSISSVSICLAYVADKLPPGHRAACFGLILASFSMGILIGPPIGGLLPPIIASYVAISCVLGSLLYVIVVLEESLSERSRIAVSSTDLTCDHLYPPPPPQMVKISFALQLSLVHWKGLVPTLCERHVCTSICVLCFFC